MTNKFNDLPEPEDQIAAQQNSNSNEFGLNPPNLVELVYKNFTKSLAYLFGWDAQKTIWRALRTDTAGNLKIVSGTQAILAPLITSVEVTTVSTLVLARNDNRSSFSILFTNGDGLTVTPPLQITFPNPASISVIQLPVGWLYFNDTWSGDVFAQCTAPQTFNDMIVTEYY